MLGKIEIHKTDEDKFLVYFDTKSEENFEFAANAIGKADTIVEALEDLVEAIKQLELEKLSEEDD